MTRSEQQLDTFASIWYEHALSCALRTRFDSAFQDLVADILERRYVGDFQRIRPGGQAGDWKCDGYIRSKRQLLQVYAPRQMRSASAISKITADLDGAKVHWVGRFDTWIFVHNQSDGLLAPVASHLDGLDDPKGIRVKAWCEPELRTLVLELSHSDLAGLFGAAPDGSRGSVTFSEIQAVLQTVSVEPPDDPGAIPPVPPGKLEANGLTAKCSGSGETGLFVSF